MRSQDRCEYERSRWAELNLCPGGTAGAGRDAGPHSGGSDQQNEHFLGVGSNHWGFGRAQYTQNHAEKLNKNERSVPTGTLYE